MAKYGKMGRQAPPKSRPWDIHPIWRGIGCILFLVGPIIAFAAAHILVNTIIERKWFAVLGQPKQTVISPYTHMDLLIDPYIFSFSCTLPVFLCCLMKFTILG
jgi:hypothetical protein